MLSSDSVLAGVHRHDVAAEKFIEYATQQPFDCVGQMRMGESKIGSAVVISSNWALTAAHIFRSTEEKDITLHVLGKTYRISEIIIHPDYKNADKSLSVDLALVRLDGKFDGKIASIYSQSDELGKIVTIVGFGRFRGAFDTEAKSDGKRAGQNVIDSIGGKDLADNYLGMDLTDPRNPTRDKFGTRSPLDLEYGLEGGDSGGGGFIKVGRKWLLAGINARSVHDREKLMNFPQHGFYGSKSYLTRVSPYRGWIESTIKNK